jgi:ABC-type dipeptide/oligopeptide/nickel transport system permease component
VSAFVGLRLAQAVLVLAAVTLLAFVLVYATGDPARAMVPLDARPEDVEAMRRGFGLDQPIYVQYLRFLQRAAEGDLGESLRYRTNALQLVLERLPSTLLLATASVGLAVVVALPLGMLAASRRDSAVDYLATGASILALSTPTFWLGIVLILLFADQLRWLPASGTGSWRNLVLPAVTLAAPSVGLLTRLVRATMTDVLRQDYVRTARAKGVRWRSVYFRHALRNCLIPMITVVGLQFGALLGGTVVIESVFAWPGLGFLLIQAIAGRDLPLIRSAVLVIAVFFVAINLVVDLLYGYVDPRIRRA